MRRYGLDRTSAGSLLSLMSLGILAASLVFGPIVDRHGYAECWSRRSLGVMARPGGDRVRPLRRRSWSSRSSSSASAVGSSTAAPMPWSRTSAKQAAARGCRSWASSSASAPWAFRCPRPPAPAARLSAILAFIGLVVVVPVGHVRRDPVPAAQAAPGLSDPQGGQPARRTRTLLLLGLMLFFQSGMEITSADGAPSSCRRPSARGRPFVLVLSLFWVGMMTARTGADPDAAAMARRFGARSVLGDCRHSAPSCSGCRQGETTAMLGLFLFGFGLAAGFPVVLGVIGELYKRADGNGVQHRLRLCAAGRELAALLDRPAGRPVRPACLAVDGPAGGHLQIGFSCRSLTRPGSASPCTFHETEGRH